MKKKAIIAAGGTGGHIIPAISIAKELKTLGVEILFVGNKNSMEKRLVTDFDFTEIDVQKLYRKLTIKHLVFPIKLIRSVYHSYKIIADLKPDFFVGTGGFVSGPVGIAALIKKIPIFIQEQNSYPGMTNRFLGKYAKTVFIAYENAKQYFTKTAVLNFGNPVNPNVYINEKPNYEKFGMKEDSFKLFLLGGSQGSRLLNKNFAPIVDKLLSEGYEIFWQTGKLDYDSYKNMNKKGLYIFAFSKEMGKIYSASDLVISRAGAITLEELKIKKIPSILIPLSIAAGNHQFMNALEMFKSGFSEIISEKKISSKILYDKIKSMKENYKKYKGKLDNQKIENSAKLIANEIVKIIYEQRTV